MEERRRFDVKLDQQLEIQAYLDGQLPGDDARRIERLLAENPAAASLAAELRCVKETVRVGEPALKVPDAREFYWSQIQRRIAAEETTTARRPASRLDIALARFRRLLMPVTGFAALAALAVVSSRSLYRPYIPGEVEVASEEMGSITFRSEEHRMTVVYLFDKEASETEDTDQETFTD
jgi:anti-sigma factor RsiW